MAARPADAPSPRPADAPGVLHTPVWSGAVHPARRARRQLTCPPPVSGHLPHPCCGPRTRPCPPHPGSPEHHSLAATSPARPSHSTPGCLCGLSLPPTGQAGLETPAPRTAGRANMASHPTSRRPDRSHGVTRTHPRTRGPSSPQPHTHAGQDDRPHAQPHAPPRRPEPRPGTAPDGPSWAPRTPHF